MSSDLPGLHYYVSRRTGPGRIVGLCAWKRVGSQMLRGTATFSLMMRARKVDDMVVTATLGLSPSFGQMLQSYSVAL